MTTHNALQAIRASHETKPGKPLPESALPYGQLFHATAEFISSQLSSAAYLPSAEKAAIHARAMGAFYLWSHLSRNFRTEAEFEQMWALLSHD